MSDSVTFTLTRDQAQAICVIVTMAEILAVRSHPTLEAAIAGASSISLQVGALAEEEMEEASWGRWHT
jgi:predicted dinucleotide-utilizing enzyme